jgi:uncharacterized surface protein with fasciclin (FAS1) repeats
MRQLLGILAVVALMFPAIVLADEEKDLINGAKAVETDIECTDGVIHVIDAVILPPSE